MLNYKQNRTIALLICLVLLICWYEQKSWQESHYKINQNGSAASRKEVPPSDANERIADYTGWLAFLTGAIVFGTFIQGYFLLRADKTARIAANAAERSARAAIALQAPVIRIAPAALSLGMHGQSERCAVLYVEVNNRGKTRAFPKEILYGWTVGNVLPSNPTYQFVEKFESQPISETDTIPVRQYLTYDCPLEPGQRDKISKGNFLWFYCDFAYEDFMDETCRLSTCWRWGGSETGWRRDETPAYNRKL